MGLESATYISDLVQTNPLSSDPRTQGDDHLRLIKKVLQRTFPAMNDEVLTSATELNFLQGVSAPVVDSLADKVDTNALAAYAALAQANTFSKAQAITTYDVGGLSGSPTINLSNSNNIKFTVSGTINGVSFSGALGGRPYLIRVLNPFGNSISLGSSWWAANGVQPNISLVGTHLMHCVYMDSFMHIIAASLQMEAL